VSTEFLPMSFSPPFLLNLFLLCFPWKFLRVFFLTGNSFWRFIWLFLLCPLSWWLWEARWTVPSLVSQFATHVTSTCVNRSLTAMSFCLTPTTSFTVLKACRMINSKKQDLIFLPANVNCRTWKASETNLCLVFGDHKNEQKTHNWKVYSFTFSFF